MECEMYTCVSCGKEINIQTIKKCIQTKDCQSFKCPGWFCRTEMHIDEDGDIKKGHNKLCKTQINN
jgi:hypothetical protein